MKLRLWPDSVFGQCLAVLLASCLFVQLAAATWSMYRGDGLLVGSESPIVVEAAARVTEILSALSALPDAERIAVLHRLNGKPIEIELPRTATQVPPSVRSLALDLSVPESQVHVDEFVARVREGVDERIGLSATVTAMPQNPRPRVLPATEAMQVVRPAVLSIQNEHTDDMPAPILPQSVAGFGVTHDTEILLKASWPGEAPLMFRVAASADLLQRAPVRPFGMQIAWQLLLVVAGVSLGAYVAARHITRPLSQLAHAADALGRSLGQSPVPASGPRELRQVTEGFNVMRDRLKRYLDNRTRVVAAMSHDLRTPLTRARLRLEMMEDGEHRREFERDLAEMETMVVSTLDALSDFAVEETIVDVDINRLLRRLHTEFAELGHQLTIEGEARATYPARPQALKRCLTNLIGNAFKYGEAAHIRMIDARSLRIAIIDRGPGIPVQELERVFEPFYRLESSRSRETGGAGLGLSVARDCAEAHGGRLTLRNGRGGGLVAELVLPRDRID